jgi:hypothetical protein
MIHIAAQSRAAVTAFAVGVIAAPAAAAQTHRWERTVERQLERTMTALHSKGFARAPLTRKGSLNMEESESFAVPLEAGRSYSIVGVCDDDCAGLNLVLSNAAGNELVADQTGDNVPVLEFAPREAMAYRIRVVMVGCRMNPCWYGVAVVEKRQAEEGHSPQ